METPFLGIGTAAWNVPRMHWGLFPTEGTWLERYAQRLSAVEINSSFYRDHEARTYVRWGESVPVGFRFSVKLARRFTHEQGLAFEGRDLRRVLATYRGLGAHWGVLLVQLPPSLEFRRDRVEKFLGAVRDEVPDIFLTLEPRHRSWGRPEVDDLLRSFRVTRVLADPEPVPHLTPPEGDVYYRLHGSPVIYESNYGEAFLLRLERELALVRARGHAAWCIFDNTKWGHATVNAVELQTVCLKRYQQPTEKITRMTMRQ